MWSRRQFKADDIFAAGEGLNELSTLMCFSKGPMLCICHTKCMWISFEHDVKDLEIKRLTGSSVVKIHAIQNSFCILFSQMLDIVFIDY